MKRGICIVLVAFCVTAASAQIRIVEVERLPTGDAGMWHQPRFSPDGQRIYFTRQDFGGIWEYRLQDRAMRQITADPGSGYGFALSPDGSRLAYRRTIFEESSRRRTQEIVLRNLDDGSFSTVTTGRDLSLPAFSDDAVVYHRKETGTERPAGSSSGVSLIGIQDTKIALNVEGRTLLLDPLNGGRYIWPSLSPEEDRILAVAMEGGAFICDLQGKVLVRLGKRNAPAWSRDGGWIIYMNDTDDGHRITGSELHVVSADGLESGRLTFTEEIFEMYPHCSPVENRMVCSTAQGEILLLTYEEGAR
jgi:Tol biopolymer transport system component